jgi:hypothetical protein
MRGGKGARLGQRRTTPASFTSLLQRCRLSLISLPNSAVVEYRTSMPWRSRMSSSAGACRALRVSSLSRAVTGPGVAAGTTSPYQDAMLKPGRNSVVAETR